MTHPVRYLLRAPFFISSRLMPAVTVSDATIHMQAVDVDREEPGDPRVRWEYIIEGPSLLHAGRDLTTPYHGPSAIDGQLPTAMGTLLGYLNHLADAGPDGDSSMPHDIVEWARRHQDDLTVIADVVENGAAYRMLASAVWRAITCDPDQTPFGRRCVGHATQQADRMATLSPRADTADGLAVRDEHWHEQALAFYTTLSNFPEPEPPRTYACAVADRDTIRAWLERPAPSAPAVSAATFLRVRDSGLDWQRIPDLIEMAQHVGIFGVREHTIRAHVVLDEAQDAVAHLLTITTPNGAHLATTPISAHELDRAGGGAFAVADLLTRYAAHVQDALTTSPSVSKAGPGPARPFPNLRTVHANPPAAATTPDPPADKPRPTR